MTFNRDFPTPSFNLSDVRPRSAPAQELISKAASSVGVMYCSSGPNTGSNPGGGPIKKNVVHKNSHASSGIQTRVFEWASTWIWHKVDLNHSCFSPAQVILIPLLTLLNIRNSLVCMLVILSVMARHIVKAFAFEPWMFYLGNFYFYFYFLLLSFL